MSYEPPPCLNVGDLVIASSTAHKAGLHIPAGFGHIVKAMRGDTPVKTIFQVTWFETGVTSYVNMVWLRKA